MKKQKIKKELSFKKIILKDMQNVSGGYAPATQPVKTYRCDNTYGGPCGPDPVPNPSTCDCGSGSKNTYSECATQHGAGCVLNTVGGNC